MTGNQQQVLGVLVIYGVNGKKCYLSISLRSNNSNVCVAIAAPLLVQFLQFFLSLGFVDLPSAKLDLRDRGCNVLPYTKECCKSSYRYLVTINSYLHYTLKI